MKLPIFKFEGYDVSIYNSIQDAARSIEVIDMDNTQACDSEGRKIHFGVKDTKGIYYYDPVIFKSVENKPSMREELYLVLTQFIVHFEKIDAGSLANSSLDELILKAIEIDKLRKPKGCIGLINSIFDKKN